MYEVLLAEVCPHPVWELIQADSDGCTSWMTEYGDRSFRLLWPHQRASCDEVHNRLLPFPSRFDCHSNSLLLCLCTSLMLPVYLFFLLFRSSPPQSFFFLYLWWQRRWGRGEPLPRIQAFVLGAHAPPGERCGIPNHTFSFCIPFIPHSSISLSLFVSLTSHWGSVCVPLIKLGLERPDNSRLTFEAWGNGGGRIMMRERETGD